MTLKLARSPGPRQMIATLTDHSPLNAHEQEVTFLAIVDPDDPGACDVWDYGAGAELGVYLFPVTSALPLQRAPRLHERHDPERWPAHVWIWNEQHSLLAQDAVLVATPAEMSVAMAQQDLQGARTALDELRGCSQRAFEEAVLERAHKLHESFEGWRAHRFDGEALERALRARGISPDLLSRDPAHLSPLLRQTVQELAGVTF